MEDSAFADRSSGLRVQRAPYASLVFGGYVCTDHSRLNVGMAYQFLNGPDVVALFQKVGGKAVAERVHGTPF
jgi:hypothetical protein